MKLELKHLAPYLPYSLKVVMEDEKTNVAWMSTKHISVIKPNGIGEYKKIRWKYAHLNIKPILMPLSNLTRQDAKNYDYPDEGHLERSLLCGHASFDVWLEFVKEHFDVFGLIEKGLAIDINTIEK